jgi:hypothetical protein
LTKTQVTARPPFKGAFVGFLKGWEDVVLGRNASGSDAPVS